MDKQTEVNKMWQMNFYGRLRLICVIWMGLPVGLRAQDERQQAADVPAVRRNGFHLDGVTGSFGFSSITATLPGSIAYLNPGHNAAAWSSASAGYTLAGSRTRFNITYTPSLSSRFQSSNIQTFNQNLTLDLSRQITPKLSFSMGAAGDDSTLEQLLLQPGSVSFLVNGQPSFDQLAAAAGAGLSGGGSPALQAIYYGTQTLSLSGQAGLRYRPAIRLSVDFRSQAHQSQARSGRGQVSLALIPRTWMDQSDVVVSYSLTPKSRIGAQAGVMHVRSPLFEYRITTATGSYSRIFATHWFLAADGGLGVVRNLGRQPLREGVSYTGSASIGTTVRRHTLVASYGRTMGDLYGFGSASTTRFVGAWSWYQRGAGWGLFATVGEQTMSGSSLGNLSAWQTSAGITRALSHQVHLSATYAYLMNSLLPIPVSNDIARHALRISVTWAPLFSRPSRPNN